MTSEVDCVLLAVDDLDTAKRRYRRLLRPLDYTVVGESQHRPQNGYGSRTVQFGPVNTSRVDLVLSESDTPPEQRRVTSGTQDVIFPAMQRHVVRDFYADALENGFKPKHAPYYDQDTGMLTTSVWDVDGNTVTVRFDTEGNPPSEAPVSSRVNSWISTVASSRAGDAAPRYAAESDPVSPSTRDYAAPPPSSYHPAPRPRRASSAASGTSSQQSGRRTSSSSAGGGLVDSLLPSSGKAVVGTLIGAAAGAALAYGMMSARSDSTAREKEFEERERLRTEARSSRYSQPMPTYAPSPQSTGVTDRGAADGDARRRSYYLDDAQQQQQDPPPPSRRYIDYDRPRDRDRDSGYQSGSSAGRSPSDWRDKPAAAVVPPPAPASPGLKYRSTTFPQASAPSEAQRSYRDRAASVTRRSDRDRASEASESTVRPVRSGGGGGGTLRMMPPKPPSSLPGSMAPPSIPGVSSKRGSNSGGAGGPSPSSTAPPPAASALHSRKLARPRSQDRLSRAQTDYRAYDARERRGRDGDDDYRANPPPPRRTHSLSTSNRRVYRYDDDRGGAGGAEVDFRDEARRRRAAAAQAADDRSSTHTARRVGLPASESGYTVRTVRAGGEQQQQRRRSGDDERDRRDRRDGRDERDSRDGRGSTYTARHAALPASEAGYSSASKLTAKNLASVERSAGLAARTTARAAPGGAVEEDMGALDDLGSVAPGDSISVVGLKGPPVTSGGEERRRKGSAAGRSRASGGSRR